MTDTSCVIRRLWPGDGPAIEAHFLRLDPQTRRDRFMGAVGDEVVLAYARRVIGAAGLVFGLFLDGMLRGIAELRPATERSATRRLGREAEAAIAIERPFRRAGRGTALFARLERAARNRAVVRLKVRCLAENRAMQALARRVGCELDYEGYEAGGALRLREPTPLSLWREGVEEGLDLTLAAAACLAPPAPARLP